MQRDVSNFDSWLIPTTRAAREMMSEQTPAPLRFMHDCVEQGCFTVPLHDKPIALSVKHVSYETALGITSREL